MRDLGGGLKQFETIIHLAAEPEELHQVCVRCGAILHDYRDCQVMVPADQTPWQPHYWRAGDYVQVREILYGREVMVVSDPPTCAIPNEKGN